MDSVLSKKEVQAELNARADDIALRLNALQREVTGAPESVRNAIAKSPYTGVGGAVAAGLLVGLIFGGSKKKKKGKLGDDPGQHRALVDSYIQSVAADARKAAGAKGNIDEAVQKALRDRVPLIIYSTDNSSAHKAGVIRETLDLVFKTALGFAVKIAIDYASARFHLEEMTAPLQSHGGVDSGPPIGAFTSES